MKGHIPHQFECFPVYIGSKKEIIHYTCNAPPVDVLNKHRIIAIGDEFGCANIQEILKIPLSVYNKAGFYDLDNKNVLDLNLESLMGTLH